MPSPTPKRLHIRLPCLKAAMWSWALPLPEPKERSALPAAARATVGTGRRLACAENCSARPDHRTFSVKIAPGTAGTARSAGAPPPPTS